MQRYSLLVSSILLVFAIGTLLNARSLETPGMQVSAAEAAKVWGSQAFCRKPGFLMTVCCWPHATGGRGIDFGNRPGDEPGLHEYDLVECTCAGQYAIDTGNLCDGY